MFHEFSPNLVNVHFPTQDQSLGKIYLCESVLNITRFNSILKTYFFRIALDLLGYSLSILTQLLGIIAFFILNFFYCSTYVVFSVIGAIQIRDDEYHEMKNHMQISVT